MTYAAMLTGGIAGGFLVNGLVVPGSVAFKASLTTPTIGLGVDFSYSNSSQSWNINPYYYTIAGGGYNWAVERAVQKAGEAVDEFIAEYRVHMEELHTSLDVIGLIPGGDFADLINSGLYLIEGDYTNATISAVAVVPFIGNLATGGKLAVDASKGVNTYNKYISRYGKAGEGMEWHHIVERRTEKASNFAPELLHNPDNIIALPTNVHRKIYRGSIRQNQKNLEDLLSGNGLTIKVLNTNMNLD